MTVLESTIPKANILAYARAHGGRVHGEKKGYESISVEGVEELPGHGLKGRVDGKGRICQLIRNQNKLLLAMGSAMRL